MTKFIKDGIEVPAIPKLYQWPDGGWRPEEPSEDGRPDIREGDRVRHPATGEEGIIPEDAGAINRGTGVAFVNFFCDSGVPIALNKLTKADA